MGETRPIVEDVHRVIGRWIIKRTATVSSLECAANEIHAVSKNINIAKVVGSSTGVAAGVVGGVVGIAANIATGGLAAPFIAAGVWASVGGVAGAVTSVGADLTKVFMLPKLFDEAQGKIKKEIDEYETVIQNLVRLNRVITSKIQMVDPSHLVDKLSVGFNAADAAINMLSFYSSLSLSFVQGCGVAAGNTAYAMANFTGQSHNS